MKTSPAQCDPPLLRKSLQDCLSEQQEEWLAAHLDDCVSCQEAITTMAAGGEHWSRVENVLRDEVSGTYPGGRGMIPTLVPGNLSSLFGHSRCAGPEVRPTDFAVDEVSARAFVVNAGQDRIEVFRGDDYLTRWGEEGDAEGQFRFSGDIEVVVNMANGEKAERHVMAGGIARDAEGFVYIAYTFNDRIQKFEP